MPSDLEKLQELQDKEPAEEFNPKDYVINHDALKRKNHSHWKPGMDSSKFTIGKLGPFKTEIFKGKGEGAYNWLVDRLLMDLPVFVVSGFKESKFKRERDQSGRSPDEFIYGDKEFDITISFPDSMEKIERLIKEFPELEYVINKKEYLSHVENFKVFVSAIELAYCNQVNDDEDVKEKLKAYKYYNDFFKKPGKFYKRMKELCRGFLFYPENDESKNIHMWISISGFSDKNKKTSVYKKDYENYCQTVGTSDVPIKKNFWVTTMKVLVSPEVREQCGMDLNEKYMPKDSWGTYIRNGCLATGQIGWKGWAICDKPAKKQEMLTYQHLQNSRKTYDEEVENVSAQMFVFNPQKKRSATEKEEIENESKKKSTSSETKPEADDNNGTKKEKEVPASTDHQEKKHKAETENIIDKTSKKRHSKKRNEETQD